LSEVTFGGQKPRKIQDVAREVFWKRKQKAENEEAKSLLKKDVKVISAQP